VKKGDMFFFSNPLCNVFSLYFMVYLGFVHDVTMIYS